MPSTIEIFCCYAREDQPLLEHLKKHLMLLQRQGLVSIWSDTNINAGDEWEKAVHAHLATAHIILLLVSPDFMASDYCYSTEMQRAMQRHSQGDARVIPILLRHTLWKGAPFADLQMLPKDAKPVASWLDKDEPLYTIADQISLLVKDLQIQHSLKEAKQLYNDQRYEGALVLYNQVLDQEPQNVHAYVGKAKTLLALQHYEESLAAFEQAEQIDHSVVDVAFYRLKASALYQLERYEESLLAYDKALQICPGANYRYPLRMGLKSEICLKKADIFLLLNRYREALEAYEQAIRFEPIWPGLYMRKGDLHFRLRDFDCALKMYEEAIHLAPSNASYHEQKGKLLLEWQHYEEALAAFDQALALSPTIPRIPERKRMSQYYEQKGQTLLKLERYEEALAAFEQALHMAEEDFSYLYGGMGQALLGLERYEEALAAFAHAIELCAPNNIDPQFYHDQGIAYERLAQRAYAMEQQSRLLWLQKEGEEVFFISSLRPQISLLNVDRFKLPRILKGHTGNVNCIAISPNGQGLVSGSSDQTVKMWEIATGEELRIIGRCAAGVYSVAISPDGQTLVTGSNVIDIRDFATGRVLNTIENENSIFGVKVSPDGQTLVNGNEDGTINIWGLAAGKGLQTLKGFRNNDEIINIWGLTTGKRLQPLKGFRNNGKTINIWRPATEKDLQNLKGHTGSVLSVAISPDGQTLVSGSRDKTIRVWELATGKELLTLQGHEEYVRCVAISPDGQMVVSGSDDKTIRVWKLFSGRDPDILIGHWGPVTSVAISPDGQTIVSGSQDNTIRVWELATGRELWTLRGKSARSGITCVAISPDGQEIVCGCAEGTIEIWGVP